jgi:hypothetical protein
MIIFDIPYTASLRGEWSVLVSNDGHPEFKSRRDAIRFAVSSALTVRHKGGETLISVEGSDGQWRMFDDQAKGVA